MLHFGTFDIRTDVFVLILLIMVAFLQMLICYKAKRLAIWLIPIFVLSTVTFVFAALGIAFDGWDSFGFFFVAFCATMLLLGCGIGIGVYEIVRKIRSCKVRRK